MITLLKMPALFLGMLAVFCCLGSFFIRENRYESGHLGETVLFGFIAYYFLFELISVPMLMLALGGLAYYLFVRYKDNKPIIKKIKIEPKLPPHQQALKEIERIKGDKTLRTADPKTYYTELTDVLRTYMEERFGFNAMEMTSSEIIDKLQEINDKESIKDLMYLFQTADLVKFAKHSPLMNENDMNLVNAVDFINNTKVEPDPNAKPEPTEITVEEKRSKQGRMILLGSISIIVIAIVVILYKVLSGVYNLWF